MSDIEPNDRLSELLSELGPEDPPPTLVRDVMSRIRATQPRKVASVLPFMKGQLMTRKIIWGIAAAAAIALAVFSVRGFPPTGAGTEGTIGAAKRYQAPQLSEKDVTLGDASAQEFMQSDAFAKLLKDPAAVKLLSDANFVAQLKQSDIQVAILNHDLVDALVRPEVAKVFHNANVLAGLQDRNAVAAILKGDISANVNADLVVALKNEVVAHVAQNAQVLTALQNKYFVAAILDSRLGSALSSGILQSALSAQGAFAAIQSQQFAGILANVRPE